MTFSALYVLPALAFLLVIQGFWMSARSTHMRRSRNQPRRARHRILFFRALVLALLVATALTMTWPLSPLSEIVQGVMITTALMIPIGVYIVINKLWPQPVDLRDAKATRNSQVDAPDLRPAPAHAAEQSMFAEASAALQREERQQRSHSTQTLEELLNAPLDAPLDASPDFSLGGDSPGKQPAENIQPAGQTPEKNSAASLHGQTSEQDSAVDQTLNIGEQLQTLDDLVGFHDIGDDQHHAAQAAGSHDPDAAPNDNPLEKAIAVARDAILEEPGIPDYSTENLPARSRVELSEMVVRLRNDKMNLQKLVIAQKAVIDSEKQAHQRTRVVVKDAISVMRHARHGQRIAEKIARRERAERLRLEKDYVKVRRALDNALSTLKTSSGQTETEKA